MSVLGKEGVKGRHSPLHLTLAARLPLRFSSLPPTTPPLNFPDLLPPFASQNQFNPPNPPKHNPVPPKMCHRTNNTFATCGHTTETTTKCRSPNSTIIPRRCLPHFKFPKTKSGEGKCMPCAIKETNAVRAAKEEMETAKMEEVVKGAKMERARTMGEMLGGGAEVVHDG